MTLTVTLPRLHKAQWEIISHPARFRVASCGRRFGKTLAAGGEAVQVAASGGRVWWVAPSYDVTKRGWSGVTTLASQIPGTEIKRGDREVLFPGGGFIAFKTSDSSSGLLGEGLDFVVIDEAALVREDAWKQDLRPALSDRLGRALFIGTPRGRNWFWVAWMMGQDPARADWMSWRKPTSDNPYIQSSEIESAKELLPQRTFSQEYLAEFLDDGGAVFRNVMGCIGPLHGTHRKERRLIFGVDWGRSEDFTVITVMDQDTHECIHLERFNQIGWGLQRGRLEALYERYRPRLIIAEENSIGGPNIEALQAAGLPVRPFTTTGTTKGPLIDSLALAFERSQITIPNDPVLVGELQAYTMERLSSGRFKYSAPSGMHDDTVISLALAWHGANVPTNLISFV